MVTVNDKEAKTMIMDCKELHERLRRAGARFIYPGVQDNSCDKRICSDFTKIPKNGVYIMFENGETAHPCDYNERIVRIGINEQQDRLPRRVKSHYNGTVRTSVFRKHLRAAIAERDGIAVDKVTEQQISDYIRKNITFVVIEVNDKKKREELEKALIATVAQCPECKASDKWLGKYCAAPKIRNGKLWNVKYLNSKTRLTSELSQLICDGLVFWHEVDEDWKKFMND